MASNDPESHNIFAQLRDFLFPRQSATSHSAVEASADDMAAQAILYEQFLRLRRAGLNLGVAEFLAALDALKGGWGTEDKEELAEVGRLLWCKSLQDRAEFDIHWEAIEANTLAGEGDAQGSGPSGEQGSNQTQGDLQRQTDQQHGIGDQWQEDRTVGLGILPVRAPYIPAPVGGDSTIGNYWPLPRRSMIHAWRYLRRPVADGPEDVLDIDATVATAAQQGFFLAPVYSRRTSNHARLVMLVDQGGSMAPLHRFTRDLVETAQLESGLLAVETYYFHNLPYESIYLDSRLTERVPARQVYAQVDGDTSVLIVSDAGAARGLLNMRRVRATSQFLGELRLRTSLIAWLNPVPLDRWEDSSAQFIARTIDMFAMDPDGMSNAVDVLRGQV